MKVTTGAAVSEEGGGGSVGASAPSHGVGGTGSVELTHWEGVRTSQSSTVLSPNIYLVNEDGKKGSFIHLITIEKHFTLLNT